jgi:hypothetical protein
MIRRTSLAATCRSKSGSGPSTARRFKPTTHSPQGSMTTTLVQARCRNRGEHPFEEGAVRVEQAEPVPLGEILDDEVVEQRRLAGPGRAARWRWCSREDSPDARFRQRPRMVDSGHAFTSLP